MGAPIPIVMLEQGMNKREAQTAPDGMLPPVIDDWFIGRDWAPRAHQLEMLSHGQAGQSALLIAPTGAGKTLAGFLPTLTDLVAAVDAVRGGKERPHQLHTIYISPLKALAVDVRRNLIDPVSEMGLDLRIETRTGDTPQSRRQRQRRYPPDILLTTPEQLALLLSYPDADRFFGDLQCVILDELHAIENTKRGDLLALGLARLTHFSPDARRVGLSATVAEPDRLRRYLVPQDDAAEKQAALVRGQAGAVPEVTILKSANDLPWAGHSAVYAVQDILDMIDSATVALVFVNTRSQAERMFQELWAANNDNLPIALHHGSLSVEQRRKVEQAMISGALRGVVCTSTLDLGIDWGAVDLVIQVGAPKGASRMMQRIGRANHRLDDPSQAVFVPSNRFEVLECQAAVSAIEAGLLDGVPEKIGALDVLAQHVMGVAVHGPFDPNALFCEVTSAAPYRSLTRDKFDRIIDFVATGGYALRAYDRYKRLTPIGEQGWLRLSHPNHAQSYRQNLGTIIEAPMLKVRLVKQAGGSARRPQGRGRGRYLGEIEEMFIEQMAVGDTFLFAGHVLQFEGMVETDVIVTKGKATEPRIPSYYGGKFPLSTFLAQGVRHLLATPSRWSELQGQVRDWLAQQQWRSVLPRVDQMLIETFPRGNRHYMVCYPFEGRLAHQTLGMLLTRRLERMRYRPLGFVASDYAIAIWGLRDMSDLDFATLFDEDMLGDDLESWLAESYLMKRTFRDCATIAGLIERKRAGKEKTGRQMTVSSDLIYDVLQAEEPEHILLEATWATAGSGLIDLERLADLLRRLNAPGRILHRNLSRVSPLAVPVLLDIGREPVSGEATDDLLGEVADTLIAEAMGDDRDTGVLPL